VTLKNTDRFIAPEPGEQHPPKPHPNPDWSELSSRVEKTREALKACAESLLARRWTVTGAPFVGSLEIDGVVMRFMKAHAIRAMSVAIARAGSVVGKRGYTWAETAYPITQPDTLFRVASVSKIFTCAAIDRLVATGPLTFTTPAFGFLGITGRLLPTQTPDSDIDKVTVGQLAARRSGLQRDFGADFRSIAGRLGQTVMPTRAQLVSYIYGEPLAARPGAVDSYSNSAFTVLTSIVEKASGRRFIDDLRNAVLAPLGIDDVHVGATAATLRRANEVSSYDDPGSSPSQLDMTVGATAPNAHGGQFALENGEGAGGLIMSTGTVARFLATHAVWNIGPREVGARYGDLPGTGAAAVSRADGLDFAYAFNRLVADTDHDALVRQINAILDQHSTVRRAVVLTSIYNAFAQLVATVVTFVRRLRSG